MKKKYFVTAIDTDIGKTYVTGLIGRYFLNKKTRVITAKIAQTGCTEHSEDIALHRKIMELPLLPEDKEGRTCPYIFSYPASPHLASELENRQIDPQYIKTTLEGLEKEYDIVITEGVGGIFVPLTRDYTLLDYLEETRPEVLLVTSARLGSINHTLCSLEILKMRNIKVSGIIYNLYPPEKKEITEDTQKLLSQYYRDIPLVKVPGLAVDNLPDVDFDPLFNY